MLEEGSKKAREVAMVTMAEVKKAMKINYFDDNELIQKHVDLYKGE